MGEYEIWKRFRHAISRTTNNRQQFCAVCSNSCGNAWYRNTANANLDPDRSLPHPESSLQQWSVQAGQPAQAGTAYTDKGKYGITCPDTFYLENMRPHGL